MDPSTNPVWNEEIEMYESLYLSLSRLFELIPSFRDLTDFTVEDCQVIVEVIIGKKVMSSITIPLSEITMKKL